MSKRNQNDKKRKRYEREFLAQVAHNIRYYRLKKIFSQEELQEKTGIKISRCETGRHDMTLTTIRIISRYLEIEPCELLK